MDQKVVDTEGARSDVRIAQQYLDRWVTVRSKMRGDDLENLDFASKYIESARRKDPNVTLLYKTDDGDVSVETLDGLEGARLCYLGMHYTQPRNDKDWSEGPLFERHHVDHAIGYLERATQLLPAPIIYAKLAQAQAINNQRKKALATLQHAIAKYPDSFDLRRVLDQLEAKPTLGAKPISMRKFLLIVGVLFLCVAAMVGFITPGTGLVAGLGLTGMIILFIAAMS